MIPQEESAGLIRGLRAAFGVSECEDIRELSGGRGLNPVFRIVVQGSAFLLRFNWRAGDLTRHYTCMKAAAEAGIAPQVWYTSVEDRMSITDFVDAATLLREDALVRVPAALRTLHALSPFPRAPHHLNTTCMFLMNKSTALDAFIQSFHAANLLPESEGEELCARYVQLAAAYRHLDSDLVSSHNDLFKPDNILFDGRRAWLIDWEAAFLNDRYADLAVVANLIVTDAGEEQAFLEEYFGQLPDQYQLARLFLMQQLAHMFYAMVFLLQGSKGQPASWTEQVPKFREFARLIWAGEMHLAGNQRLYGRVHWQEFANNVRLTRFDEALQIVSKGRT